jgi:hypothetical protein
VPAPAPSLPQFSAPVTSAAPLINTSPPSRGGGGRSVSPRKKKSNSAAIGGVVSILITVILVIGLVGQVMTAGTYYADCEKAQKQAYARYRKKYPELSRVQARVNDHHDDAVRRATQGRRFRSLNRTEYFRYMDERMFTENVLATVNRAP